MESDELKELLLKSIQNLKPRYRKILTMRCYQDMEFSQIAKEMELSEFATKVAFHRAKRQVGKFMAKHGFKGSVL